MYVKKMMRVGSLSVYVYFENLNYILFSVYMHLIMEIVVYIFTSHVLVRLN